jgi:hypothetical protein
VQFANFGQGLLEDFGGGSRAEVGGGGHGLDFGGRVASGRWVVVGVYELRVEVMRKSQCRNRRAFRFLSRMNHMEVF